MAGHNKWSKVKHIKAKEDAKKGKLFSRFSKEISIAARDGGGDPDLNPRLRTAVETARRQSMPKDNIERAIKKGTGELGGDAIAEITYEGYAPGGVAMLIEVVTDNRNRSAADVRYILSKNGGTFADAGSVAYLFERRGEIRIPAGQADEEKILDLALEAGALDVASDETAHVVTTSAESLSEVATNLGGAGLEPESQELTFVPQTTVAIDDTETARKILRLYELLDDYDDTHSVHANFEIPDAIFDEIAAGE